MKICLRHGLRPGGRCPDCAREADAARGTRRERGIGPNHEAMARELRTNPAAYSCSICLVNGADAPLTVGHIVPRVRCLAVGRDPDAISNLQPECRRCNLQKGANE